MESAASLPCSADEYQAGQIDGIPVRNLWLLMLYASNLFRCLQNEKVALEEMPDDIPDLVAEVLARCVERRLRRNLSAGYESREAELSRVRGRINFLNTERHQLLARGKIACSYEDFTVNTPRNCFVRAALEKAADLVSRRELARRCRSLSETFKRMGVTGEKPSRSKMSTERFGRHDSSDQKMVAAAQLTFDLALLTEMAGTNTFARPERKSEWIRNLFEKAVAGFYDVVLSAPEWRVYPGKPLSWKIDNKTSGIDKILPTMRTDIVLENNRVCRRIIIDTKFTSIVDRGGFRAESLKSNHIYQIYSYLRSQEGDGDPLSNGATGILLYPSVATMVDESATIQGHAIRFATVDLGGSASEIRERLIDLAESSVNQ